MTREDVDKKISVCQDDLNGMMGFASGMRHFIDLIHTVLAYIDERTK